MNNRCTHNPAGILISIVITDLKRMIDFQTFYLFLKKKNEKTFIQWLNAYCITSGTMTSASLAFFQVSSSSVLGIPYNP